MFSQAGARVAFSYEKAQERAEALAAECGGRARCIPIQQELSTPADGHSLVAAAVAAFGRLDILVVNHGIWPSKDVPVDLMPEEQWRRTLAVNLDSVFGLVQATVAQMEKQTTPDGRGAVHGNMDVSQANPSKGHIVLISSTAGQRGEAYHVDYAVTKGALISLTKSLSSELAPKVIRVNCVAPGWVATDMSAAAVGDPEMGAKIRAGIPVGRVASTREIAGPVLFLCTPLAGFISGEVLNVNGGAVLVG